MTKYEELEDFAYNNGIDVVDRSYNSKCKGSSMVIDDQSAVFLKTPRIKEPNEKICVLAEEIGHVQTGTFIDCEDYLDPDFARYIKMKNKQRAKKWAVEKLLPLEDLLDAIDYYRSDDGYLDYNALSDCHGFPVDYICSAIEMYITKGRLTEWLEPTGR